MFKNRIYKYGAIQVSRIAMWVAWGYRIQINTDQYYEGVQCNVISVAWGVKCPEKGLRNT